MAADPTLQAFFGPNATQDATTITIQKSDLVDTATPKRWQYTPTATDTAERILLAIILRAAINQDTEADAQIAIASGGLQLATILGKLYRQYILNVRILIDATESRFPDPDKV